MLRCPWCVVCPLPYGSRSASDLSCLITSCVHQRHRGSLWLALGAAWPSVSLGLLSLTLVSAHVFSVRQPRGTCRGRPSLRLWSAVRGCEIRGFRQIITDFWSNFCFQWSFLLIKVRMLLRCLCNFLKSKLNLILRVILYVFVWNSGWVNKLRVGEPISTGGYLSFRLWVIYSEMRTLANACSKKTGPAVIIPALTVCVR